MSIKISDLKDEIAKLKTEIHDSDIWTAAKLVEAGAALDEEKKRFKPIFRFLGKQYGWRKEITD